MASLRELKQKRAKIADDLSVMLKTAEDEERALYTVEEDGRINERSVFDEGEKEIEGLNARIQQEEEHRGLLQYTNTDTETDASQFADKPDTTADAADAFAEQRSELDKAFNQYIRGEVTAPQYSQIAGNIQRDIDRRTLTEQRAATNPLYQGANISGGFVAAPQEFVPQLIREYDDVCALRALVSKHTVKLGQSLGYPRLTQSFAGAAHGSEISSVAELSTPAQFGKREWKPNPITGWIGVSADFLTASVIDASGFVQTELARVFQEQVETDMMTGDGANQSLGVFTASDDGIPTAQDVSTGNSTTTIAFDGLKNAKNKLDRRDWPHSTWVFHTDAIDQIDQIKYGDGHYVWNESVQDANGIPRLLGFPVQFSDKCPNTFTTGLYVGIVGRFNEYLLAEADTVGIKRLDELYALSNQVVFLLRQSVDGMPRRATAFARVTLA